MHALQAGRSCCSADNPQVLTAFRIPLTMSLLFLDHILFAGARVLRVHRVCVNLYAQGVHRGEHCCRRCCDVTTLYAIQLFDMQRWTLAAIRHTRCRNFSAQAQAEQPLKTPRRQTSFLFPAPAPAYRWQSRAEHWREPSSLLSVLRGCMWHWARRDGPCSGCFCLRCRMLFAYAHYFVSNFEWAGTLLLIFLCLHCMRDYVSLPVCAARRENSS
jgi:hypothetical protein